MKDIKLHNVSRADFDLSLDFVKEGKIVHLKKDASCIINKEEYDYLKEQCRGMFENGFIEVLSVPEDEELVESENVMSDEDIEKLFGYKIVTFKNKLNDITSQKLLKDIYRKAIDEGKQATFIKAIESRIKEVNESIVL